MVLYGQNPAKPALPQVPHGPSHRRRNPRFHFGKSPVARRVKDFIDISEYTSLDDLVRYLETIRDNLPPEHQAELRIRGDEVFGRRLTITYFREQTPEEVELESKYSAGDDGGSIEDLRRRLDDVPFARDQAKKR
jgi:hypothetical protein